MANNSTIEWTDHTFNPWWGCVKVSHACKHCYAQTFDHRLGGAHWGARSPRRFFGEQHWGAPLRWQIQAQRQGVRKKVFCASMADVFERRGDLNPHRERLWGLIEQTPDLDWLLLTKRPQNIGTYAPWKTRWPRNVWLGTTVENQKWANQRIPLLLKFPATIRFLSCEPLLGAVDLSPWIADLGWVIAGGESGHQARPTNPLWLKSLATLCQTTATPFHFKQWGHWAPAATARLAGRKNPRRHDTGAETLLAVGKAAAGRELDGRYWDQAPA